MSLILNGTDGVTFNDTSLQGAAASPYVLKNRIINGDMRIDQRNAGVATANTIDGYTLDRWQANQSVTGKLVVQQTPSATETGYATRVGAGFTSYLAVTSQSAYSILSSSYYVVCQYIEGLNIADLAWGTSNAKTVTLSFFVYSSLTGTFGGALRNNGNTRSYPFTYTISSANTWTQISVTIAGDQSGTWLTTNGVGLNILFGLGVGSTYSGTSGSWAGANYLSATGATSVVGTNGATFYITGVQLEVGSTATPFERRLYGQELANCMRYLYMMSAASNGSSQFGFNYTLDATTALAYIALPTPMRSSPTLTTAGTFTVNQTTSAGYVAKSVSAISMNQSAEAGVTLAMTIATGTSGGVGTLAAASTASRLFFSAEL